MGKYVDKEKWHANVPRIRLKKEDVHGKRNVNTIIL